MKNDTRQKKLFKYLNAMHNVLIHFPKFKNTIFEKLNGKDFQN